jgi:hypothetical protein
MQGFDGCGYTPLALGPLPPLVAAAAGAADDDDDDDDEKKAAGSKAKLTSLHKKDLVAICKQYHLLTAEEMKTTPRWFLTYVISKAAAKHVGLRSYYRAGALAQHMRAETFMSIKHYATLANQKIPKKKNNTTATLGHDADDAEDQKEFLQWKASVDAKSSSSSSSASSSNSVVLPTTTTTTTPTATRKMAATAVKCKRCMLSREGNLITVEYYIVEPKLVAAFRAKDHSRFQSLLEKSGIPRLIAAQCNVPGLLYFASRLITESSAAASPLPLTPSRKRKTSFSSLTDPPPPPPPPSPYALRRSGGVKA